MAGFAKKVGNGVKNNPKAGLSALVVLLAASSIGEGVHIYKHHKAQKPAVCRTPACVFAANMILSNLDPSVSKTSTSIAAQNIDVCTNFDQFVCGGFQERQHLKEDQELINGCRLSRMLNTNVCFLTVNSHYSR